MESCPSFLAHLKHVCGHFLAYSSALLFTCCPVCKCLEDFCQAVEPVRGIEKKTTFLAMAFASWCNFIEAYAKMEDQPPVAPAPPRCSQHAVRKLKPEYDHAQVVIAAMMDDNIADIPPDVVSDLHTAMTTRQPFGPEPAEVLSLPQSRKKDGFFVL